MAHPYNNKSPFNCWKTHVQRGTKMKNGREVPNCVPKNSSPAKATKGGGTTKKLLELKNQLVDQVEEKDLNSQK
jgi:hypothetical protein